MVDLIILQVYVYWLLMIILLVFAWIIFYIIHL